jgi:hypothetical protein
MKYELNQRVVITHPEPSSRHGKGQIGAIVRIETFMSHPYLVRFDDGSKEVFCSAEISPVDTSHTTIGGSIMSTLTVLAKKVFDKDTKTLIKAGVLNNDLEVANQQFVLSFLVDKYKAELAALAQEQLDEDEKKS